MIISPTNLTSNRTTSTTTTTSTTAAAAAATAQAAAPGGAMGKDQFLKLLIAQMQNQDPMSPMQGDQMAAQLAQFSSLEQLQQMNDTLSTQSAAQGSLLGAIQSTAAIGTIGHSVIAAGNQIEMGGSAPTSAVTVDLAGASAKTTLHIYDANGTEVGTRDLGATGGGRHTFDLGDAAKGLGDGTYTYSVDATNTSGDPVAVTTYMTGKVNGLASTPNGLVLNIGDLSVPYSSVVQILN